MPPLDSFSEVILYDPSKIVFRLADNYVPEPYVVRGLWDPAAYSDHQVDFYGPEGRLHLRRNDGSTRRTVRTEGKTGDNDIVFANAA
ncbi:hypothetical protein TWF679_007157 [Orbilia oligospora]|uniref:Uncharacterized protein n=1 Tax=Orbilia oligospora TaxID=2813651 RepID=A0A8H8V870_ORBOL|nr:hypothetical protein TWF679_007157 [Orbilia oligospora]